MGISAFEALCKSAGRAIGDFGLINPDDRILIGISGGKDSFVLARVLFELQKRAPIKFELLTITFDPGFDGFGADKIAAYCRKKGYNHHQAGLDIGSIIRDKQWTKTPCVLCSRLRRGMLYRAAEDLNCNKLALGHHLDDLEVSFLISLFRGQGLSTMPPLAKAKKHPVTVIRPLVLAEEKLIIAAGNELDFPRDTGKCIYHQELETGDRKMFRKLLDSLSETIPDVKRNILHSMRKVEIDYLLDKRFSGDKQA